ncbi:ABC transporter ATP-binding protein [Nocardioides panacihumi]|uniref:ABC transporter ATP-binding protein n=1 Tax=Nocardioides panacihumi TaxID=400774 RepID=A0ABP5D6I8_9ACTN
MSRLQTKLVEHLHDAQREPAVADPRGILPAADLAAIRTEGLTKEFGKRVALDHVDLRVPQGVVFGYLGPNGAGKSTTIRSVVGLIRATSGLVEVLGHDVARDRDAAQRLIGYLPGDFVAYPDLTAAEYLHHLTCLRGGAGASAIPVLAERLDLPLDRRFGSLSHGNRQKVGIVQAFMHEPPLLVLDEPSTGLDPLGQREFLAMVREARDQGRTVFLSSHVLSEVEAVADVVGVLRGGRLMFTDSLSNLQRQALRRIDLVFGNAPPVEALRRARGVHEVVVTASTAHVRVEGSTAELLRAAAPYGVENVRTHEADLGDLFLGWYGEGGES